MVVPLFVGREKSIRALDAAMADDKQILLVAQTQADVDDPGAESLYPVGTVSSILQMLRLPDGTVKVLVEGGQRANVLSIDAYENEEGEEAYLDADVELIAEPESVSENTDDAELIAVLNSQFEQYVKLSKKVPAEVLSSLSGIESANRFIDTIATHLPLEVSQKQEILAAHDKAARTDLLLGFMDAEIDLHRVEKKIRGRVKKQMEKSQREYYLNEQMKAIQKELGDMEDVPNELDELQAKIADAGMTEDAEKSKF